MFSILFCYNVTACREKSKSIEYVNCLTEITANSKTDSSQLDRIDFFIIHSNGTFKNSVEVDDTIKKYSALYAEKYINYVIYFYKYSETINVKNIESFPKGYEYKALYGDRPIAEFRWYMGRFFNKKIDNI